MESIAASSGVLACLLVAIAWVDSRRFVIPDLLNLSLALCGLAVSAFVLDRVVIYVLLESGLTVFTFLLIVKAYEAVRAKRGLGLGDVKFLGAASIWVGVMGIPWVILISSISGLAFAVASSVNGRDIRADSRIAFGPHLSLGLMLTWLMKDVILIHG